MSNSIMEAMACGLPIITTNTGGAKELIKERENGFIVEKGDIEELKSAIEKFLIDRNLQKTMGIKSRYHTE